MWGSAPAELVQELGLFLGTREWAAARQACRHWRAHVTASVQMLELDLERSPHRWSMVTNSVRRLFPRLRSVTLLIGTRVGTTAFSERMAELAFTIDLPELELRYVPIAFPRMGAALSDIRGVTELLGLRVLKVSGGPTPSVECIEALSSLRKLQELEVLPGDYGVLHGDLVPPNEGAESPVNYGLTDDHCAPIERLTTLTSLLLKVKPEGFSHHGLASLASLPDLQSLVVYDAELPSEALSVLERASKLTALQVGIIDLEDLAPLKRLPRLIDLYLDTCQLEDMRQLPVAAAVAGLPVDGPRSLTGLYSVDQLFPTQEHLSALGELTGLRELVLEGPAMAMAGPADWGMGPANPQPPPPQPGPVPILPLLQFLHAPPALQQAAAALQQQVPHALGGGIAGGAGAAIDDDEEEDDDELDEDDDAFVAPAEDGLQGGQGNQGRRADKLVLDLTPLSRLVNLEVLQLDKREEGDGYDGVTLGMGPATVRALAEGWTALNTLDLYNITPAELPSESLAEMSRLTALRSLSISSCPHHAAGSVRRMGWWEVPRGLTALSLTGCDLSSLGTEECHRDGERMSMHFSDLHSLRLHFCSLPPGLFPSVAAALSEKLHSLSLVDVDGSSPAELEAVSQLTALSTLRLLPRGHGIGGTEKLLPLRLKQLKLRLQHLERSDLPVLARMTSLFLLTLTAPMADGHLAPGLSTDVKPSDLEEAAEGMPYCDVEIEPEPEAEGS